MIASNENSDWTCSLLGWGLPSDPLTFSGYGKALGGAMKKRGMLRTEFSVKQLRAMDLFTGAYALKFKKMRPKLTVRRSWVWKDSTSKALEHRLNQEIERSGDRGSFLQIGTICEIDKKFGEYAVVTDMTVPQAHRAGQFFFGNVSTSQYNEAVKVQRRVLHQASHVFTLQEWCRKSMIEDFDLDPAKVSVCYLGSVIGAGPDASIVKKPKQILFVGIDWKRKGGAQLVEGFRLLRERIPDAELVVVGCSPEINCPGVRVEGFLNPRMPEARAKLAQLYQESTCFALMSEFDPTANVIIEAYSMGLPVVALDSGSRAEFVQDGQTGFLCQDREPKSIADALYKLLSSPAACKEMGRNALGRIAEDFNWDAVVSKIVEQMAPQHAPLAGASRGGFAVPKEVAR